MRLYLDNQRPAPPGWTLAKNLDEAKKLLVAGGVERASLDYDLNRPETGMQLLEWMKRTGHWPRYSPRVHSTNPEGAAEMRAFIAKGQDRPHAPRSERKSPRLSKGGSSRYHRASQARLY